MSVYSSMPITIEELRSLDALSTEIQALSIGPKTLSASIFIYDSEEEYSRIAELAKQHTKSQGFNIQPVNNIFVSRSSVVRVRSAYGNTFQGSLLEGDLFHVIAHELAHTVINEHIGYFESLRLEFWISEGMAEYIASIVSIPEEHSSIRSRADIYLNDTRLTGIPIRKRYLASALLVEHLIEKQHYDIESILRGGVTRNDAVSRFLGVYGKRYQSLFE